MNAGLQAYQALRALPLHQAGRLVLRKVTRGLRGPWRRWRAECEATELRTDLRSLTNDTRCLAEYLEAKFSKLSGFPLSPERRDNIANLLRLRTPGWVERCLEAANGVCDNRLSILGHEFFLGESPNWHKDYMSGTVWPLHDRQRPLKHTANSASDIKFVWELSMFYQGVTLGRAFAVSGDESYARKFVSLLIAWQEANPAYAGPNWLCAMEVAIRAVNLLWCGALMSGSEAFDAATKEVFVKTLLTHGVFIYRNLEYSERVVGRALRPVNGNHYLANLAGLLHISIAFPEYRQASEWQEFALQELFCEIRLQVDDDGVHYEYCPGYHRLVLEMILACLVLCRRHGLSIPHDVQDKAVKMLEFVRHYRKPSNGVPLVRDLDNGRFCILGAEELTNHDHVLALGAILFDRADLYPGTLFEDCLWHLGPQAYGWHREHASSGSSASEVALSVVPADSSKKWGLRAPGPRPSAARPAPAMEPVPQLSSPHTSLLSLKSRLFPQSGFCIMRHESQYLLAVCCPKGARGHTGHTHNDFLSFELEAYGRTFLTDCGSYVYTQSPEWRNSFRSTCSHNTVMVDGQEQNHFTATELFEIASQVRPTVQSWASNAERDVLDAAYALTMPEGLQVTHERRFVFLKNLPLWLIRDRVQGLGQRTIETRFHYAEGIDIAQASEAEGRAISGQGIAYRTLCMPGPNLFLVAAPGQRLTAKTENGWVSRTYASKTQVRVLCFSYFGQLPFEQWYVVVPTSSQDGWRRYPVDEIKAALELVRLHQI